MTTSTEALPLGATVARHPRAARFGVAFVAGLAAALALGAGVLYGYDRQYEGRILPGVSVGSVDLSGLTPAAARSRLEAAYAGLGRGELALTWPGGEATVAYDALGRRLDVDGLVEEAASIGHAGSPFERVIGSAKTALRGVVIEPRVLFDRDRLATRVRAAAAGLEIDAVSAGATSEAGGVRITAARDGRTADADAPTTAAIAALGELNAPARVSVGIPTRTTAPTVTDEEAGDARAAAERMARDIELTVGDEKWTIKASTVRTWLRFSPTVDGRYVPILDVKELRPTLDVIAAKIKRDPVNATFLVARNNAIFGVTAGRDGRSLDRDATARLLVQALQARAGNTQTSSIEAAVAIVHPTLTTEEAQQAAPLMKRISTWTTWFPIGIKNGQGNNIWIPASDINGYVVGPGEKFDFWRAIGPITRARGYRDGGAIINGRTEPQGALAGGICSTSTTLFNAALRAGFDMGSRRNHYYYIDRYPLGLDATVFKSGSGATQTMSWTNDTNYPVLIRAVNTRSGSKGYVRFDLYSVPNGRKVEFTRPIVRNVRKASDSVQHTSSMPKGQTERIEYPVDGKDVWVTRIVRDANGRIIHRDQYYSHYARITGILLVGTGGSGDGQGSSPSPSP